MSALKYIQREYDKDGNFIRTREFDPVIDVSVPDEWPGKGMFINADMQLSILPAYKEQTVIAEYIGNNELITKGHFPSDAFRATKPIYFKGEADVAQSNADAKPIARETPQRSTYTYIRPQRPFIVDNSNQYALGFLGRFVRTLAEAKATYSTPMPQVVPEKDLEIEISFDYKVQSVANFFKIDVLLFWSVQVGAKWLNAEPLQWQDNQQKNSVFVGVNDYDLWKTFTIRAPKPEFIGEFSVYLYQVVQYDPALFPEYSGQHRPRGTREASCIFQVDNVSGKLLYNGGNPQTQQTRTYVNNSDFTLVPEPVTIYHADVPEYQNREIIYPYAWRVVKGDAEPKLTDLWQRQGYPEQAKLIDLVLATHVDAHKVPSIMITGTINHTFLPVHYVRINYFQNRIFKVNGYRYNVRMRSVEVELLEVLTGLPLEVPVILMEDGRMVLAEKNENNEYKPIPLEQY